MIPSAQQSHVESSLEMHISVSGCVFGAQLPVSI